MSTSRPSKIALDTLLDLAGSENRATFVRLQEQLATPMGVVPFVGAGLSVPCGMPTWSDTLLGLGAKIGKRAEVEHHLRLGGYEEAAQLVADALGPRAFVDRLDELFNDTRLNAAGLSGPVLRVPELTRGPVLTTNFDHVLERVFEQRGRPFTEIVWGAKPDMLARALYANHSYLIKLHGDVLDRADRILTLQDYARHYGDTAVGKVQLDLALPNLLVQAFTTRTLLFLGCSLGDDRTVRLLHRVATTHGSPPPHYAIVEQPTTTEEIYARARFLSDHNIRPLWFPPGRYDAVEVFLEELLSP